jgi:hypothetical protein
MVRVEVAFLPVGWPGSHNAAHAVPFGSDDEEDATSVRFAEMNGAHFAVSEYDTGVDRIVFNYLLCFYGRDLVEGDVVDIAVVPLKLHEVKS